MLFWYQVKGAKYETQNIGAHSVEVQNIEARNLGIIKCESSKYGAQKNGDAQCGTHIIETQNIEAESLYAKFLGSSVECKI